MKIFIIVRQHADKQLQLPTARVTLSEKNALNYADTLRIEAPERDTIIIIEQELKLPPCEECKKHVDKSLPPVGDVPPMPKVEPPKEDKPICVVPRLRKAGECGYEASYECRHVDAGPPTKEDKPTPCPECETKDKEIGWLRLRPPRRS